MYAGLWIGLVKQGSFLQRWRASSGPWPRGPQPTMGRCHVRAGGPPAWLAGLRVPGPLGHPAWATLAEAGPSAHFFF